MNIADKLKLLDKKLCDIDELKGIAKDCKSLENVNFADIVLGVYGLRNIPKKNYEAIQQRYNISLDKSKQLVNKVESFLGDKFFKQYRKDINQNKRKHHTGLNLE
jgi:hypothetical protein